MKAVTCTEPGEPSVLTVSEVEPPEPGPGEILVRVVASGINRADLLQRRGHYRPPPGTSEILGLEVSGTVAALGDDVAGWELDRPCVALLSGGGYAEYVAVPAGQVLTPPEGVDLEVAGGVVEVAATVVSNLDLGGLRDGNVFAVHGGAGGIGSFAVPYAKALGATVLTTAGSEEKLDYCRSIGADLAVSYRSDWPAAFKEFTGGRGVDVLLDNMGAKYLESNVDVLAVDGRLMVIGLQGGRQGTLDLGRLLAKRGGVFATTLRSRPPEEKAAICARLAEAVWPLYADGSLTPAPQTRFPLAEAGRAHALMEAGDHLGKIVLVI